MKKEAINHVLIIDDEPAIRILQRVLLRRSRFSVGDIFEAGNGIEAIDIMSRNDIDLILTDIEMPVMNGIEFLNIIHNHHKFKDIPVVAATAETGEQLLNMLAFWGHGYIRKPLRQSILEKEISKFYGINNEYYLHG